MKPVSQALGELHVSPIEAVMGIARRAGSGMTVTRWAAFAFPTCRVQVWEFSAALPPLDRPPVRVAVMFKSKIRSWIDLGEETYEDAVARYAGESEACLAQARALAARETAAPGAGAPAPAPRLPAAPPGVRVTLPAGPGGKPLGLAPARASP
ncbi:MAG: hypothetical protein IPK64_21720 [bacterium]|nr:hypothetical protein [bacterium]